MPATFYYWLRAAGGFIQAGSSGKSRGQFSMSGAAHIRNSADIKENVRDYSETLQHHRREDEEWENLRMAAR
jgi:hypothetical protein